MSHAFQASEHTCGEYANGWNAKSQRVVERIGDLVDVLYGDARDTLPKLEVIKRLNELQRLVADPVSASAGRRRDAA